MKNFNEIINNIFMKNDKIRLVQYLLLGEVIFII